MRNHRQLTPKVARVQEILTFVSIHSSYMLFYSLSQGNRPPWRNDYNDTRNRGDYSERYPYDKFSRRDDPKRHDGGFRNRHEHQRYHNQRPGQRNYGNEGPVSKNAGDGRHLTVNRHDESPGATDRHDSSNFAYNNRSEVISPHYGTLARDESGSPHYVAKYRLDNRSDSDHR